MVSPNLRITLAAMKALLFLCAAAFIAACSGPATESARSPDDFPLKGIDISQHQGRIDWDRLREEGLDFIYIKATEGTDWIDPRGESNLIRARNEGYRAGAYHYYLLCKPAMAQAANFIDTVPIAAGDLPPAIDLEHADNCGLDLPPQEVRAEVSVMISQLRRHYGQDPVIYTTNSFYAEYLTGAFPANPIWIRDLGGEPVLPDGRAWTIWQHHHRGRLHGITGPVDLNVAVEGF